MLTKVSLVKGNSRTKNIEDALGLIEDQVKNEIKQKDNILIKPNLTSIDTVCANSHIDTVEKIIEFINQCGEKHIFIGESSSDSFKKKKTTWDVFENFGYPELEEKYENVTLVDFDKLSENDENYFQVPVLTLKGTKKMKVLKNKYDYIISLALPKTHDHAIITLSLKNMMGIISPKDRIKIHGLDESYYSTSKNLFSKILRLIQKRVSSEYERTVPLIHKNLVTFFSNITIDLSIIDGYFGMEGNGPRDGNPVRHKIAIASQNAFYADLVCSKVMGFDPSEIGYLYYSCLQQRDSIQYEILGEKIENVQKKYSLHDNYEYQRKWKVV